MDCKIILISSPAVFIELCNGLVHSLVVEEGHNASIIRPRTLEDYEPGELNIIIKAFRPIILK